MTTLRNIDAAEVSKEIPVNDNFETVSAAGIFGKKQSTTSALTWGGYGGRYNGNDQADWTVSLTDNATNYIVVLRSTAAPSVSTSTTHSTNPLYARVYKITTSGGAVTAVVDERWETNGLMLSPTTAGIGDVVGPGSATDGHIPQFDGTTGKLLKDGLALDTDGTLAAASATRVPSQSAVKTYVDNAVTGLWDVKGATDCSANPNYPSALKGDAYVVSVAGKIGGASGTSVDVGDVYVALLDNAGGTEASVGTSWFHIEHNLVGVALLASPAFTGNPTAPTPSPGDNDTSIATTAFVMAAVAAVGGVSDGDKGDITVSGSGATWTVDNDVVSYAKMQNVSAASRLLGRGSAGGSGDPEELTAGGGLSILATVLQAAFAINAQSGTSYAIVAGDRGKHVTLSNAASIAATIAQAGTTGFEDGYFVFVENIGVGAVTLTPTTSTVNGAATLVLTSGMAAMIFSDGTNYRAIVDETAGVPVNAQTGTSYTYLSGDRKKLVTHTNASAIAGTLPQATGAFGASWFMWVQNRGVGTLTITPTTSTIDGAATLALTTGQGCLIASDGTNYYTMRGIGGGGGSTQGRHAIFIAAGSMSPSVTGGCAPLNRIATTANQPDIASLDFDTTTQEFAQFYITMPKSWNASTVTFCPIWSHAATTTNFGVVWQLQLYAASDNDAIATAYGTAQTSSDTGGTTNNIYKGPESSAITIAGTPAKEDTLFGRVGRVPADGGDTLAIDARLMGLLFYVTTDADTDT